jgi:hypothetical protein
MLNFKLYKTKNLLFEKSLRILNSVKVATKVMTPSSQFAIFSTIVVTTPAVYIAPVPVIVTVVIPAIILIRYVSFCLLWQRLILIQIAHFY